MTSRALPGALEYRRADHAFAFEPECDATAWKEIGAGKRTSLAIDTLQIEVAIPTGRLLYVWGYHPVEGWREDVLRPPASQPGRLHVESSEVMIPGVSVAMNDELPWITSYDPSCGWICVRDPKGGNASEVVEFASDTLAEVAGNRLIALWLHPRMR